ncbi:MAG: penicillin-binding transpeptidase domain-containing protein [Deltaproteobacteria bacterium]|nr:penicillin-binding transpeptidase domain-containing protein [Deltaproteobacteria bacterium]
MRHDGAKRLKARIILVALFYLSLFAMMVLRGYQLQIFRGEELGRRAERQLTRKIELPPVRGKIFDRNGEELATNREVNSVYAQPLKITDGDALAEALSGILGEEKKWIKEKISAKSPFVWIKRSLPVERGRLVADLHIAGVGIVREKRRYYPNMELAGHLIGFAGIDSQGLEGVELEYNDYIKGTGGYFLAERDALGRNIFPAGMNVKKSSSGNNVVLTIDRTIQHITERELGDAVKGFNAKAGMALVMDPATGEVLAMAVEPAFNPNDFEKYGPRFWRNRIITDTFEPGSTFKIFLAAAAIDSGRAMSKDIFYCENGRFRVYDRYIHDGKSYGWLSLENILKVSSNIGAFKIAEKTGKEAFYRYISDFGFGAKTGIGLPGEASGYLRSSDKISPIGYANLAFGQGISVTALQLVNAISAIANGGHLMKPYVVKRVIDGSGRTLFSNYPVMTKRVISKPASKEVSAMLKRVTSGEGTGVRAALQGYLVAGKTGTSQKYDFKNKKYSRERHISSFVGFIPADDPKLSIVVILDEPKNAYYGGRVAAPVFRRIASQSLAYLNVSPLREKEMPGSFLWVNKKVRRDSDRKDVPFFTAHGEMEKMPDLKGMTLREILVNVGRPPSVVEGNGVVVDQFPRAGQAFNKKEGYRVKLADKPLSGKALLL